jgi:hypothetical protein
MPTKLKLRWDDVAMPELSGSLMLCDICSGALPTLGLICTIQEMTLIALPTPDGMMLRTDGSWALCHPCRKMMGIGLGDREVPVETVRRRHFLTLLDLSDQYGQPKLREITLFATEDLPDFDTSAMVQMSPGISTDFQGNVSVEVEVAIEDLGLERTPDNVGRVLVMAEDLYGKPFKRKRPSR